MRTNILLLLAGVLLAFFSVEVLLRVTHRFSPPEYPPKCIQAQPTCDLYEPTEAYGYRLKPSRNAEYYYPYYNENRRKLSMNSNEFGFRSSRGIDNDENRTRIIVLGDSQTFGEGVEESERFSNLVESSNPEWLVDNLAMPGFSPDLMLMALESVGIGLQPDVVVFVYFADDFSRVYPYYAGTGFKVPHYRLRSGGLVKVPYPEPQIWDRVHLTWAIRDIYWKLSGSEKKLNSAIISRFIELSEQHDFTPLIMYLPFNFETEKKRLQAEEDRSWLNSYSEEHAIPLVDLTEVINSAGWNQVLIEINPHFNPTGHEVIAFELRRFLSEQVVISNP